MGVPGLWDLLRPAGKRRSLTNLAVVDGFERNVEGTRGLRIGIDASIWFYHATYGREGENPELRTLFFRCSRLLGIPLLPLFVFDGPKRPSMKRNKKISGKAHWLTEGMKNIIEAFGFEWHMAPGEAEAELAFLSKTGVIDAVLSDDVDTFVFGGTMVVRNPSSSLSGNRSHPVVGSSVKDDGNHVVVFSATDFNLPEIDLTRGGLILIALLSGGDYHQAGLSGCGPKVAHGLARCGFGDSLLSAARTLTREDLQEYLVAWKKDLAEELRTNSRGVLGRRYNSLSKAIPEEFPDIDILMSYSNPITSETEGKVHKIKATWERPLDLGRIAHICELYFEWGVRHVIIKRFRTMIWPAAVLRFLRESVLEKDMQKVDQTLLPTMTQLPQNEPPSSSPTTSAVASLSHLRIGSLPICRDLVLKIHSVRNHNSTDGLLEYRLEVSPEPLIALASAGIKDIRPPLIADISSSDDTTNESDKRVQKPPPDPSSNLRVWISACIVKAAMPSLVDSFDEVAKGKATKKTTRTNPANRPKRAGTGASPILEDTEEPRKRESRPKQDLKAFYSVTKPLEQTLKPATKPPRDDRPVLGGRSRILSLIDDIAAADTSKRDGPKAPSTGNYDGGGFPATKAVTPRLVDGGNQSRSPLLVQGHPTQGPDVSPTPTLVLPQKESTPSEVIEISSDSDEGDPAPPPANPKVAPLLVARSRRRARPQIPDDIIDLT